MPGPNLSTEELKFPVPENGTYHRSFVWGQTAYIPVNNLIGHWH